MDSSRKVNLRHSDISSSHQAKRVLDMDGNNVRTRDWLFTKKAENTEGINKTWRIKMEQLAWWTIHIFGGSAYLMGILANWDNPIGLIMGIIGIFYAYWVVRDKKTSTKIKEAELRKILREEEEDKKKLRKIK